MYISAIGYSFDCIGRNNSCSESHMKCDTGYDPFCQHVPGPAGRFIGFCTCDKGKVIYFSKSVCYMYMNGVSDPHLQYSKSCLKRLLEKNTKISFQ